jgi:hypothetical protein
MYKAVFDELRLSVRDANGEVKDASDMIFEVGKALKNIDDQGTRMALASRLAIDRTMVTTLTSDTESLSKMYDDFAAASQVDLQKAAAASSDLMDEFGRFGKLSKMVMQSVMTEFIIKMRDGLLRLRKWIMEHADTVRKVITSILNVVERMGNAINAIFYRIGKIFGPVIDWWNSLDESVKKAITGIGLFAVAWKKFNAGFLLTPIGRFIALLTALFLLYDDFMGYLEGKETAIDWGPWADTLLKIGAAAKEVFTEIRKWIEVLLPYIVEWGKYVLVAWVAFKSLKGAIGIVNGIKTAVLGTKAALGLLAKENWILLLVGAIAAIAMNWDKVSDAVARFGAGVRKFIQPAIDAINDLIAPLKEAWDWFAKMTGLGGGEDGKAPKDGRSPEERRMAGVAAARLRYTDAYGNVDERAVSRFLAAQEIAATAGPESSVKYFDVENPVPLSEPTRAGMTQNSNTVDNRKTNSDNKTEVKVTVYEAANAQETAEAVENAVTRYTQTPIKPGLFMAGAHAF